MRNKRFCYFHHASRVQHPNRIGRPPILPDLPILEDAQSIQLAYNQVAQGLVHRAIDSRTAGRLTCLLQYASANLANFKLKRKPPRAPRFLDLDPRSSACIRGE